MNQVAEAHCNGRALALRFHSTGRLAPFRYDGRLFHERSLAAQRRVEAVVYVFDCLCKLMHMGMVNDRQVTSRNHV